MLKKKSKLWFLIGAFMFALVFMALYFVFMLYSTSQPKFENISGFILLSAVVSAMIAEGGYYGAKYYALTVLVFNLLGLSYIVFVANQDSQIMMHPLSFLISYLVIFLAGLLLGVMLELVTRKIKMVKKQK